MANPASSTPGIKFPWWALLPLAAAFGLAIWQMRFDWIYDESYYYGWSVLPLALYLFSLRWRDRPAPGPPLPPAVLNTGWVLLSLLYPLTWLVREANPEWRLIGVALSLLAVLTSWQYLAATGGKTWLKHFAGPALFFLTSTPWPSFLEKSATAILMPANATIALEVLHWLGIPAIRSGHLITIAGGTLGVEEACSGIRSLQSTLMMAWFLGELYHLRFATRGTLLACGVGFALFTNSLRTVFLSTLAARSGLAAAHGWHDTAGFLALGANLLLLFFLTIRFSAHQNKAPRAPRAPRAPPPPPPPPQPPPPPAPLPRPAPHAPLFQQQAPPFPSCPSPGPRSLFLPSPCWPFFRSPHGGTPGASCRPCPRGTLRPPCRRPTTARPSSATVPYASSALTPAGPPAGTPPRASRFMASTSIGNLAGSHPKT